MNKESGNGAALFRFKCEQKQKLHELCDFIEDEIGVSALMSEVQFSNIMRMCRGVQADAFDRSYRILGIGEEQVQKWTGHQHTGNPTNESAILLFRALLCEMRRNIGARPTARVSKEKERVTGGIPAPATLPDGVVLADGFAPDTDVDTSPTWQELGGRLRNAMKNDDRKCLLEVLGMNANEFLRTPNVSYQSFKELVRWCHRHGLRGKFFDHPMARRVIDGLERDVENTKLGDGMT